MAKLNTGGIALVSSCRKIGRGRLGKMQNVWSSELDSNPGTSEHEGLLNSTLYRNIRYISVYVTSSTCLKNIISIL